jgi:hypothetical protein
MAESGTCRHILVVCVGLVWTSIAFSMKVLAKEANKMTRRNSNVIMK